MSLYDSKTYIKDLNTAIKATIKIEQVKGKSILITGATGTIGSFLVDMLLEYNKQNADVTIWAAGRNLEKLSTRFDENKTEKLKYVEYDLLKPISFNFEVDYIIHAAGNAYPVAFNTDPVGTIVGNVNGTYMMLEYARTHGTKRFCYISSGEVYGQGNLKLDSFDENYSGYLDITSPRSCYPASKRTAETLCASYSKEYGLETIIVRPCHTYGPGMTMGDNRANVQFVRNVLNGVDIILISAGTQLRSYCYIADCASIILTVLINGESGQAYNSANSSARITIAGLADKIAKNEGKKVVYENPNDDDLANRSPIEKQVLNTSKVEALGWSGKFSVDKGISHLLAIMRGD